MRSFHSEVDPIRGPRTPSIWMLYVLSEWTVWTRDSDCGTLRTAVDTECTERRSLEMLKVHGSLPLLVSAFSALPYSSSSYSPIKREGYTLIVCSLTAGKVMRPLIILCESILLSTCWRLLHQPLHICLYLTLIFSVSRSSTDSINWSLGNKLE